MHETARCVIHKKMSISYTFNKFRKETQTTQLGILKVYLTLSCDLKVVDTFWY